jgi:membrane protease YdiL (CAAX protease family)
MQRDDSPDDVTARPGQRPSWAPWAAWVLVAVPLAWALARAGFGLPVREPLRDLAWLWLVSAAEEVLFRGALQPALHARLWFADPARRRWGITPANAVTSLAFAAAHIWNHPPIVALGVLPVSLLLGWSLERSGRLAVPVLLHAWFNTALYGASWALQRA